MEWAHVWKKIIIQNRFWNFDRFHLIESLKLFQWNPGCRVCAPLKLKSNFYVFPHKIRFLFPQKITKQKSCSRWITLYERKKNYFMLFYIFNIFIIDLRVRIKAQQKTDTLAECCTHTSKENCVADWFLLAPAHSNFHL